MYYLSINISNPWLTILIIFLILLVIFLLALIVCFGNKRLRIKTIKKTDFILDSKDKKTIEMYLVKLKTICDNNPEYQNYYIDINSRFKTIFDTKNDLFKKRKANLLKKLETKRFDKNLKNSYITFIKEIELYQKDINSLLKSCEEILKQDQDLRKKSVEIKQIFRELNNSIETFAENLKIISSSLKNYLTDIDVEFDLFESAMSQANYQDANNRLSSIENKINFLYGKIPNIASKCQIIENIIPEKLELLKDKNENLLKQDYVVMHLRIKDLVTIINDRLDIITNNYRNLNFEGFDDDIIEIENKISEASLALDDEVASKINFDNHYQEVIDKIKKLETEFLKIKRQYTSVLEYYYLDEEIINRFNIFQLRATSLSDQKREFESYIIVNARNPYSFMIKKMNDLSSLFSFVEEECHFFEQYFHDLKSYVENTYEKITKLSKSIIVCKGYVRKNKLNNILYKYNQQLDKYLNDLKIIIDKLYIKPINVSDIKNNFSVLEQNIENICIEITNEVNDALLATKAILFANQLRDQFIDLDNGLTNAEMLFEKEEYKKCANMVVELLKKYHPVAYNILRGN